MGGIGKLIKATGGTEQDLFKNELGSRFGEFAGICLGGEGVE